MSTLQWLSPPSVAKTVHLVVPLPLVLMEGRHWRRTIFLVQLWHMGLKAGRCWQGRSEEAKKEGKKERKGKQALAKPGNKGGRKEAGEEGVRKNGSKHGSKEARKQESQEEKEETKKGRLEPGRKGGKEAK